MLAKKPLTDRAIAGVKPAPPGKRRLLWDAIVPGLALRVTDKGNRTFVLVTRYPGSRNPTPRSLGAVGAISLADARDTARQWLGQIRKGSIRRPKRLRGETRPSRQSPPATSPA